MQKSCKLVENYHRMTTTEKYGLAKNRFISEELQSLMVADSSCKKTLHANLANNRNISKKTVNALWSDKVNRGYSTKMMLIAACHFKEQPEKYWELYRNHPRMWSITSYRARNVFVGSYSTHLDGSSYTPSDLLNEIYDKRIKPGLGCDPDERSFFDWYGIERNTIDLAKHKNCDLSLAIKLSVCGVESTQQIAFKRIVELSK